MRDWILRLLAVLSAGVVLLAPALPAVAADDLGLPAWYGGAVKAFWEDSKAILSADLTP